jgi:transcriptional regulator with XRE-family HTH domain
MGRAPRKTPLRLAAKLRQIRELLGVSQNGIIIKLGYQDTGMTSGTISNYELGKREPSMLVIYAYAKLANIYVDVLLKDALDLPDLIPSEETSAGKKKRK